MAAITVSRDLNISMFDIVSRGYQPPPKKMNLHLQAQPPPSSSRGHPAAPKKHLVLTTSYTKLNQRTKLDSLHPPECPIEKFLIASLIPYGHSVFIVLIDGHGAI